MCIRDRPHPVGCVARGAYGRGGPRFESARAAGTCARLRALGVGAGLASAVFSLVVFAPGAHAETYVFFAHNVGGGCAPTLTGAAAAGAVGVDRHVVWYEGRRGTFHNACLGGTKLLLRQVAPIGYYYEPGLALNVKRVCGSIFVCAVQFSVDADLGGFFGSWLRGSLGLATFGPVLRVSSIAH